MSNIADPNLIYEIPAIVVAESLSFLRIRGSVGVEGVVLWPGKLGEGFCEIKECLVPRQIAGPYFYRIPDDETFRIIEKVAGNGSVIPIQVHSHPEEAFHSWADDERAFVQHTNGISIVVPNFGNFPERQFLEQAVIYSLVGGEEWRQLSEPEKRQRFLIGD